MGIIDNKHNRCKLKSKLYNSTNTNPNNSTLNSISIRIINDLFVSSINEEILVVDSGCDQSIISYSSFVVGCHTGIQYSVDGALGDMKSKAPLEVVNRFVTCCTLTANKNKVLIELNQCLLDLSNQSESLLQPHQARAYGVIVNEVAKRHLATDKL